MKRTNEDPTQLLTPELGVMTAIMLSVLIALLCGLWRDS